ncbi:MAG TPA: CoA transferase [Candidatus Binatia bacterium]|nr:CoA transferase [Candidatus Binatia bacterium]
MSHEGEPPGSEERPLSGVVVVDLTRVLAGPFCTLVLAQLGARVIKVESPDGGDDARAFGPIVNGRSLYFSAVNYDKQSIALDLKSAADRATFEALLAVADVVAENFRPGTMERLGYGWESLHARHPRLIYAALSGFGQTGPLAARPAYDMVVQGMGGVMSVTGHPGAPPTRVGVSIGDLVAGLYLATGVSAALFERARTGVGAMVDVAMLDCQVAILEEALAAYLATGEVARPLGDRHPRIAPFGVFRTASGHVVVAAGNDRQFAVLCDAIGRPELARDARYATNASRLAHVDVLRGDLERSLASASTERWLAVLEAAGVACGPVNDVAAVARHPQVAARNMILSIADPALGELRVAGSPIKLAGRAEPRSHRAPPALDGDRADVLAMLARRRP